MILEWSIDIYIRVNIRGNISAVMLVIMWKCFVSNIGYYIGIAFGCGRYKNIIQFSVFLIRKSCGIMSQNACFQISFSFVW